MAPRSGFHTRCFEIELQPSCLHALRIFRSLARAKMKTTHGFEGPPREDHGGGGHRLSGEQSEASISATNNPEHPHVGEV